MAPRWLTSPALGRFMSGTDSPRLGVRHVAVLGTRIALMRVLLSGSALLAQDVTRLKVGPQPDGRIVLPTNQVLAPAGRQVTFPGRPVDIALLPDGVTLVVKNMQGLEFIDSRAGTVTPRLATKIGLSAVGLLVHRNAVYVTDCENAIHVARR